MQHLIARYAAEESGASAVEYALVVTLIAVAVVGVLSTLGVNLANKAGAVADAIVEAGA